MGGADDHPLVYSLCRCVLAVCRVDMKRQRIELQNQGIVSEHQEDESNVSRLYVTCYPLGSGGWAPDNYEAVTPIT